MPKEGKISIKHYLYCTTGEPLQDKKYPVYVRVVLRRQNTKFKSNYHYFSPNSESSEALSIKEFEALTKDEYSLINNEKHALFYIIKDYIKPFQKDEFDINGLSKKIQAAFLPIDSLVSEKCRHWLRNSLYETKLEKLTILMNPVKPYSEIRIAFNYIQENHKDEKLANYLKNELETIDEFYLPYLEFKNSDNRSKNPIRTYITYYYEGRDLLLESIYKIIGKGVKADYFLTIWDNMIEEHLNTLS